VPAFSFLPGAVISCHLDYYLDEYVFQFNMLKSALKGKLFYRLVQKAVIADPVLGCDIKDGITLETRND